MACLNHGRPVVHGGILDLATFEVIVGTGTNPMNDLATPSFDGAQRAAVRRNGRDFRMELSVQTFLGGASDDAQGFLDLVAPHLHSVTHVPNLQNGHSEQVPS